MFVRGRDVCMRGSEEKLSEYMVGDAGTTWKELVEKARGPWNWLYSSQKLISEARLIRWSQRTKIQAGDGEYITYCMRLDRRMFP